jgi:hypothetical protein
MTQIAPQTCTAFDHHRQIASGSYAEVAFAVKERLWGAPDAAVLIFDDATGNQIDFDLRGTAQEVAERLGRQFPSVAEVRAVGRPKLGVVSREVTLLPTHWEWLGQQTGGASAALRRLVEDARRAAPSEKARLRKIHERAYKFMSAMAGNLPRFEEASRALFANDMAGMRTLISDWPGDVRGHIEKLSGEG